MGHLLGPPVPPREHVVKRTVPPVLRSGPVQPVHYLQYRWQGLAPWGLGMASRSRTQASRALAGRGAPEASRAGSTWGFCAAGVAAVRASSAWHGCAAGAAATVPAPPGVLAPLGHPCQLRPGLSCCLVGAVAFGGFGGDQGPQGGLIFNIS